MQLGRVSTALTCCTIVFWRVVVVAMNSAWAIAHDRWIDASLWLSEDPFYRFETAFTRLTVPNAASPNLKLYLVEVVGIALWMFIAFILYRLVLVIPAVLRLNSILLSPLAILTLATITLIGSYCGARVRTHVTDLLHVTSSWWLAAPIMLLSVVASGALPVLAVSWALFHSHRGATSR